MNPSYSFKTIDDYTFRYIADFSVSSEEPLVAIVLDGEHDPSDKRFQAALREAHNALFDLQKLVIYSRIANKIGYSRSMIDDWNLARVQYVSWVIETLLQEKYWDVPKELKPVFRNTLDILLAAIRQRAASPKVFSASRSYANNPGYVYLLQSPTSAYKIGRTSNPENRIKTFGVKLPFEVEYICLIRTNDMVALETELHERFAHKRVNGEWFRLAEDDVTYIKGLAR